MKNLKDIVEAKDNSEWYVVRCIFVKNSFEYIKIVTEGGPMEQSEAIKKLDELFKSAKGEKTMSSDKQNFICIDFGKDKDEFNTEMYSVRHKDFIKQFKYYDRESKNDKKINI